MAGVINKDDIAAVRERAPIEDIISAHVALKPAGVGTLKGLCPFHDERTPSFTVRPLQGRYHCFGCGEGGDVIEFVMRMDGLGFADAVEYLAPLAGVTLRYEAGSKPRTGTGNERRRLLDANRAAAEFYEAQLSSPAAQVARDFLRGRGFDQSAAVRFGLGFAPAGWNSLTDHLRSKAFTEAEILGAGLASPGQRGIYDRFRGRLVWPIRDVTGEVIGFGARKLLAEDNGPKYLNTPETVIYKKNQVLYGLDLARTAIRQNRQVVVVEGYTDVMAMHLAGIETAIATCGTAFGEEHVKTLRRLMGDVPGAQLKVGGQSSAIIFTFDGDEAGQNAALKSFQLESSFLAQTFVAVDPAGLDPCDIRLAQGDAGLHRLLEQRQPLYEFVLRTILSQHDLDRPEGQLEALRAAIPVINQIRDQALRPAYGRLLAGWLGMETAQVLGQLRSATTRSRPDSPSTAPQAKAASPDSTGASQPDVTRKAQGLALGVALQIGNQVVADAEAYRLWQVLDDSVFTYADYRDIFRAINSVGFDAQGPATLVPAVMEKLPPEQHRAVSRLVATPLPMDPKTPGGRYARSVLARLRDLQILDEIARLRSAMKRTEVEAEKQQVLARILELEQERIYLRGI